MPFEIDPDLPHELAPLAWLVGRWEGAGVVGYPTIESVRFGQEVVCTHDTRPVLEWHSHTWRLDEEGQMVRPLATELGFWRVLGSGEVELSLTHQSGIVEMYAGRRDPDKPVIELATDSVVRGPEAKEYSAGKRLYGLVEQRLMWAFDMAAVGQPMTSHASAELKRVA